MRSIIELEKELQEYKQRKKKKLNPDEQVIEQLSEDATPEVIDVSEMEEVFDGNGYHIYQDGNRYYCSEHGYCSDIEEHMESEHDEDLPSFECEFFTQKLSKEFKAKQEYVPSDVLQRMALEQSKQRLMQREMEAQKLSIKKIDSKVLHSLEQSLVKIESYLGGRQDHCPLCNLSTATALSKTEPSILSKFFVELSQANNGLNIKTINDLDRMTFEAKVGGQSTKVSALNLLHLATSHRSLLSHWNSSGAVTGPAILYFLKEEVKLSKDEGYKVPDTTFKLDAKDSNLLTWLRKKNQYTTEESRD